MGYWRRQKATCSFHAAYYLVRRAVLAHFYPGIRAAFMMTLRELSLDAVNTSLQIWFSVDFLAPYSLRVEHGYARAKEYSDIDDEMFHGPAEKWRFAHRLLTLAAREKESGTTGRMERCWTRPPVQVDEV